MIYTIPERIPNRTGMRNHRTQLATLGENDALVPARPVAILAKCALTDQGVLIQLALTAVGKDVALLVAEFFGVAAVGVHASGCSSGHGAVDFGVEVDVRAVEVGAAEDEGGGGY